MRLDWFERAPSDRRRRRRTIRDIASLFVMKITVFCARMVSATALLTVPRTARVELSTAGRRRRVGRAKRGPMARGGADGKRNLAAKTVGSLEF